MEGSSIKKAGTAQGTKTAREKAVSGRSVNIRQLAAHLGLSPTTVSRVMNDSGAENRIALDTQQRVLKAAASLNYAPNAFARGLRNKKSFTVGVMIPEISEKCVATVLAGIGDALLQENFFYFVLSHRHRAELLQSYPRLLLSRGVEGIIAVDTQVLEQLPVPIVAVSGSSPVNGMAMIELDHESLYDIGRTAANTLLQQIRTPSC
jgi:DNA-binding LacI/PurR family transcriptional regulator